MKKIMIVVFALITVLALSACTTDEPMNDNDPKDNEPEPTELLELTLEDLAMYDGTDGNAAYIAVNGVVYDVTNVSAWNNGTHNGAVAGTDVSNLINGAPHGDGVLDDLEVVGEIIE